MIYETSKRSKVSHVWILQEGEFKIKASPGHEIIHAVAFGDDAWNIEQRGYFQEETGTVTCHTNVEKILERRLEKFLEKEGLIPLFRTFRILGKETDEAYD